MDMADLQANIELAARWISEAPAILITAGAGMGVDSGLPDFRGPQGLWKAYPALGKSNWSFQEIAAPQAFLSHPELAWGFYAHRLQTYRDVQPHAGFGMLLNWGLRAPSGCRVFTSNVDGHFQKAGFESAHVAECHGSLHSLQCFQRGCSAGVWSADGFQPRFESMDDLRLAALPHCPLCGALARPNVLMFDDIWWNDGPYQPAMRNLRDWCDRQVGHLLVVELGAGKDIPTVRHFGQRRAHRFIRINLRESEVPSTYRALGLAGSALDVLARIDALIG